MRELLGFTFGHGMNNKVLKVSNAKRPNLNTAIIQVENIIISTNFCARIMRKGIDYKFNK